MTSTSQKRIKNDFINQRKEKNNMKNEKDQFVKVTELNKNLIKEVLEAPKETQLLVQGFMAGLNVSQTARKPA